MVTEQDWLASLGITDPTTQTSIINGTTRLLILDASAHMDWDWLLPFPVLTNYSGPVDSQACDLRYSRAYWYFREPSGTDPGVGPVTQILDTAGSLLTDAAYAYSVCETGFLRGYAMSNPQGFQTLLANGGGGANARLRSAGGGVTSPDNLLPHAEAFIRNYLIGHAWLAANAPQIPVGATLWMPDDFGHDPQLPVLAQAMGMIAAGFERVPGTSNNLTPLNGSPSVQQILLSNKSDFLWTADDGSQCVGHFLQGGYGQGNNIATTADIASYLATNAASSPTPYLYVPVLSDFSLPNKNLASVVGSWNNAPIAPYTNVLAVCGSFEVFAQLLTFHASEIKTTYAAPFNANPFFTGCYGTRPEIKIRHQRAVRALLAAEALSFLATWVQPGGGSGALGTGSSYAQELADAWNILVPSTHHDFITGTAIPDVFHTEQLSLLRQADARAKWLLHDTMRTIAGAIQAGTANLPAIAVFNTLGFERTGLVELTARQVRDASISTPTTGAQVTADGGLLFPASAPSLGYQTVYLGNLTPPPNLASAKFVSSTEVMLSNGLISATLTPDVKGVWGLTSVQDVLSSHELVPPGTVMNDLVFYADGGDEYGFGPEKLQPWILTDVSAWLSNPTIAIVEQGPLRAIVRTAMTYNDGTNPPIDYVREYIVHANEPMLRMRTTGAAPPTVSGEADGVSVLVAFPLSQQSMLTSLVRGTPSHWTSVMPTPYWNDQTFVATHNFVIPSTDGVPICAIYHADVPAWGLSNQQPGSSNSDGRVLYGCLWRNGVGQYFGWVCQAPTLPLGQDPDVHVREYALRLPGSASPQWPATGQPLQESLAYASPLLGLPVAPLSGQAPQTMSLASASAASAIISVAKPGTVNPGDAIVRVYQPTNAALSMTLTLASQLAPAGGGSIAVRGQTALEQDLSAASESQLNLTSTATTVSFTAPAALTTLAITP